MTRKMQPKIRIALARKMKNQLIMRVVVIFFLFFFFCFNLEFLKP